MSLFKLTKLQIITIIISLMTCKSLLFSQTITTKNFEGIEMVLIKKEKSSGYWISKFEITQSQYENIMGQNPCDYKDPDYPVNMVSWYDAIFFCNKLSEKAGLKPYYNIITIEQKKAASDSLDRKFIITINKDAKSFRLPYSKEWEYAARAGTKSKYFWGEKFDESYCWFKSNSRGRVNIVGTRKPNAWGLYDMCGNVEEYCYELESKNSMFRITRGGFWDSESTQLFVNDKSGSNETSGSYTEGIRLVKDE